MAIATKPLTYTRKPLCVVCHDKPARIGKVFGYEANLVCSQRCALEDFMNHCMDFKRGLWWLRRRGGRMIAWMYHDSTKARQLRNSQPLRWLRITGLTILILSALAAWRIWL